MPIEQERLICELRATGRFRDLSPCAEGASAYSFTAYHRHLERSVFIKLIDYVPNAEELILREPRALVDATKTSPKCSHAVEIYDATIEELADEMFVCLQMEMVEGESLFAAAGSNGIGQNDAVRVAYEVAIGVSRLHSCGLVHRDLKPANVMVSAAGAKITDLGSVARLPESGILVGGSRHSALYVPPEGWAQPSEWGQDSDVYQIGMLLYVGIHGTLDTRSDHYDLRLDGRKRRGLDASSTGDPSWMGIEYLARRQKLLEHGKTPMPFASASVARVIKRATNPNRTMRYPTAAKLASALAAVSVPNWKRMNDGTFVAPGWRGKDWIVKNDSQGVQVFASRASVKKYRRSRRHESVDLSATFALIER